MLFILVGTTLDVGHNSREYFKSKGFEIIDKYNYTPDGWAFPDRYDTRNSCTENEVDRCDFVYKIHNGKTGFYKSQIIDAVRGRKNCMITMSPDNLEFIREIKDSYGEYVTVVYLYIDEYGLKKLTKRIKNPDPLPGEIESRLEKGISLRRMYLTNISDFDKVVLYSGEETEYNFEALYMQFDYLINKAELLQKKLNDKMYVELPYTGNKGYIFVSYSHKDEKRVIPILSSLQREGFRIWYDEGIHGGENWSKIIAEKIKYSTDFLLFSSENAISSDEIESEIYAARKCKLHPITIRLDDSEFELGDEMFVGKYHNIFIDNPEYFIKLKDSLNISTKE